MKTRNRATVAATVTLFLVWALALTWFLPAPATALPFEVSADGTEVTDLGSGLVWRRCVEGMHWDGATCAGTPEGYSHGQAPQQAAAQWAATGLGWRLPTAKELDTLDAICPQPAGEPAIFPATPEGWYWSVSPNTGYLNYELYLDFVKDYYNLGYAWYVNFLNDSVHGYNRGLTKYVRLVRYAP